MCSQIQEPACVLLQTIYESLQALMLKSTYRCIQVHKNWIRFSQASLQPGSRFLTAFETLQHKEKCVITIKCLFGPIFLLTNFIHYNSSAKTW